MGAINNATDKFVINDETHSDAEPVKGHVHGPNCGHDHAPAEDSKKTVKYPTADVLPEGLNLKASFANNRHGPIWKSTPADMMTVLGFYAGMASADSVQVCFLNTEAYKFLLSLQEFQKQVDVVKSIEQVKKGVLGVFMKKLILVTDAFWEPNDQVTMHKAMYFCDGVVDEVVEVTLDAVPPKLCEDEGCDHHGTDHVCLDSSVNDKAGRCINCLDTGCIAGDPDQLCGCPAGDLASATAGT